ncbi:MAG: aminodeoxychorismate synthase component I [Candidatus Omnitrophota bacterium]|nr:aminodeoxychorismate synthase component I [Candidatus Omnitrophota bacterium]
MAYSILKSYKLSSSAQDIFSVFKERRNCFFLDTGLAANHSLGRYSFLGADPFYLLKADGRGALVKLQELLRRYKMPADKSAPPFLGGAVGFLSYDLGFSLEEKIKTRAKDELGIPDCFFGFYNSVVIIDHLKNILYVSCLGFPEKKYAAAKSLAENNFKKIHRLLALVENHKSGAEKNPLKARGLSSDFSKIEYLAAVRKAKDYIRKGDIYQVNLSQRFEATVKAEATDIYRRLRETCPTYFSAYFDAGNYQVISASPERFLKLEAGLVSTRPMKGTRPRSVDRLVDRRLKQQLLAARKDKAELMMIVDLERNDLGRACAYNSVKVDKLREIEEYATVYQATASIRGRLGRNKDMVDLLRACFPGGSITGCPKIRAMEIIEELEPGRRGIYTGALGYLSFSGNMDMNILIRTILKMKDKIYFHAGGGIVADSKPEEEYRETLVKAKAMLKALNL